MEVFPPLQGEVARSAGGVLITIRNPFRGGGAKRRRGINPKSETPLGVLGAKYQEEMHCNFRIYKSLQNNNNYPGPFL